MAVIIRLKAGELPPPQTLSDLAAAAKSCKIIAFPTDTVYGLGSTALVKAAGRRIYQIKGRPAAKPLPVFVKSAEAAKRWVEWTPLAESLAKKFWPGVLTLVLRPTKEGRLLTFAEYQTVALRVPDHPLLLRLLELSDVPWAQTSANISGSPALQDGEAVAEQFKDLVDYIISAETAPGAESTVVDATGAEPRVIREGAIPAAAVKEAAGAAPC
ncbi:MAG TPA: L-threonylcarbamoyladenylate synthase [Elusimicrobiota bacterium]|nr:L-threonylcarbamoyladenylate synthase [Elusimicrobiota bacterium]